MSRQKGVQFAMDNNRIEGLEPSQEFIEIAQNWVGGNLTHDEFERKVYEIQGVRYLC